MTTQATPSVESLIKDAEDDLFAHVAICDALRNELDHWLDLKREVLRKLTNLRMAAIAQEKGQVQ